MIGLDVGDRRIGVAAADGLGLTAQGLPTIERRRLSDDLDSLIRIITERNSSEIVVGLPKNMDGSVGSQGEKVRRFTEALTHRMVEHELDPPSIVYWDERLTTVAAQRMLIDADISRKKRKGAVDKIAAVLILQGYLDHLSRRGSAVTGSPAIDSLE